MRKIYVLMCISFLLYQAAAQEMDIQQLPPQEMLELGALFGNLQIVKAALARGADINYREKLPLCKAIYGATPPPAGDEGNFVQMMASIYGITVPPRQKYIELMKWLLQNGAQANASADLNSDNIPLLLAAEHRDLEIIKLLLDFKADPNSKDQTGTTALHILTMPAAFHYAFKTHRKSPNCCFLKGKNDID